MENHRLENIPNIWYECNKQVVVIDHKRIWNCSKLCRIIVGHIKMRRKEACDHILMPFCSVYPNLPYRRKEVSYNLCEYKWMLLFSFHFGFCAFLFVFFCLFVFSFLNFGDSLNSAFCQNSSSTNKLLWFGVIWIKLNWIYKLESWF